MDGLTHAEMEKLAGESIGSKVRFYLMRDGRYFYRVGDHWFEGT